MIFPEIFSDHMVFQREKPIRIFGNGYGSGTVFFDGKIRSFRAEGDFIVEFPAHRAGGPYEIIITFSNDAPEPGERKNVRLILRDVMVGDVFLAGGQSNMEFRLRDADATERTLEKLPKVRYFEEPHSANGEMELSFREKKWELFTPENEPDFSAVAYYFACKYSAETDVPLGIVSCCRGASRADAWMSPETEDSEEVCRLTEIHHEDKEIYRFNQGHWLYENKLKNVIPFALKGVLWYQGESNRRYEEAVHYDRLFEILVKDWRRMWADELPFYTVQLMPFDEAPEKADWAEVRAAQERASKNIPGVRMVTLFDTGEASEIHPTRKKGVGEALAKAVLADAGKPETYSGPVLKSAKFSKDGAVLSFLYDEGLFIDGDTPKDLEAFSKGKKLEPDAAVIDGKLVLSGARGIDEVRLGFRNACFHNLKNSAGYLASPFRILKEEKAQG